MKTLKAIFRIPLLVLILYLGSVSAYEVIPAMRHVSFQNLDWRFYAYALQGALELVLLVWIYRWLGARRAARGSAACDNPVLNDAR